MFKKLSLLILFFLFSFLTQATAPHMDAAYKEGETLGQAEKGNFKEAGVKDLAGYQTSYPAESSFYYAQSSLSSKSSHLLHNEQNKAGSLLLETERTRGKVIIDPDTDPLIRNSDEIVSNPEKTLVSIEEKESPSPNPSEHFCYEAGVEEPKQCAMRRLVTLKEVPAKTFRLQLIVPSCSRDPAYGGPQETSFNCITEEQGGIGIITVEGEKFDPRLRDRIKSISLHSGSQRAYLQGSILHVPKYDQYTKKKLTFGSKMQHAWIWNHERVLIDITYDPLLTENDIIETIEDSCSSLESLTDEGRCHYGKELIVEGEETRLFKDLTVKRPWWHKQRTYYCGFPSKNNCDPWRKRGCYQVHSVCHKPSGKKCLEWKQTFHCPPPTNGLLKSSMDGKDLPFGLDGSCATQSWKSNEDMTEVLAKLSLLQEIKKESLMAKGQVFQGNAMGCSKHCLNFSDCCALSSGWGKTLKLTSCSASEKLLAQKRKEGKCHLIGTYCSEKERITKICLKKKTTFCCYDSKLARVVQEGARCQIGLDWESAKAPNCRALTVEEFSKVNFDKINFSEIFKDVLSKIKLPDSGKILDNFQKNWKSRLPSSADLQKAPESHSIGTKIIGRQASVSKSAPGSYSLNENPPGHDPETPSPQVVF